MINRFLLLGCVVAALCVLATGCASQGAPAIDASQAKVIIEAEALEKEEGGTVLYATDRPGATGSCITTWNFTGHMIEWSVNIPADGEYKIVLRYAGGREWTVYREVKIDGKVPNPALAKIALPATGGFGRMLNEWVDFTLAGADKKPVYLKLAKGKHVLRITNLGGDGADGAANLDRIGFLGAKVDTLGQ